MAKKKISRLKYKTTKKDFETFKRYCEWYIDKLRVGNWRIYYEHEDPPDGVDKIADVEIDLESEKVQITLYTRWHPLEVSDEAIQECAFHEIQHIRMARLMDLAGKRYIQEQDLEDAEHEVIRAHCHMHFSDLE